jgi:hypothetical protein
VHGIWLDGSTECRSVLVAVVFRTTNGMVPNRIAGTGTLEGNFLAGWLESSNESRLEVSRETHPGIWLASSGSGLSGPCY